MNDKQQEKKKVTRNHSPETRAKIAASMAGNKNAETSERYKKAKKRKQGKRKPRTLTAEHKKKISDAMRKNALSNNYRKLS